MKLSDILFFTLFVVMATLIGYKFLSEDYTPPEIKKNDIAICNYNDRQYTTIVDNVYNGSVYFHNMAVPMEYCKRKHFNRNLY